MRRVLHLLLVGLVLASAGCGASSDTVKPPAEMTPEQRAKKAEEAKAANDKGMNDAAKGSRPGE